MWAIRSKLLSWHRVQHTDRDPAQLLDVGLKHTGGAQFKAAAHALVEPRMDCQVCKPSDAAMGSGFEGPLMPVPFSNVTSETMPVQCCSLHIAVAGFGSRLEARNDLCDFSSCARCGLILPGFHQPFLCKMQLSS